MIQIKLDTLEELKVRKEHKRKKSKIKIRCFFIILSSTGKSPISIAEQTGFDVQTVRKWLKRYILYGLSGLKDKKPSGRKSIKEAKLKPILEKILRYSPLLFGYIEDGWTINLIIDYVQKTYNLSVSESTVKRALKKNDWAYKRFSETVPENAPSKKDKKARVAEIITSGINENENLDCEYLLLDEANFSNKPYVQKGWFKKGEKKKIAGPKRRSSITIFGALNLKNQKFNWKSAKKGNSNTLIEFLHQLHSNYPNKLLFIIIDNASFHKSKKIKKFLEKNSWVKFEYLPPYSPEYNPIERFWKWLKRKIYGTKSFKTIKELLAKIRKFIWHYRNNKKIVKLIKFNFKSYSKLLNALRL